MNDIEATMTLDLFGWARNGRYHTAHLIRRLMVAGIAFERCSYSDTRCEYDILFTFGNAQYMLHGGCGSTLEFHSVDKTLDRWWSMRPDPPNIETIVYRMLARLRGEKVNYDHVVEGYGQPLIWHRPGMPWPNKWVPPATMDRREQDESVVVS